jgi:hypothetical protein
MLISFSTLVLPSQLIVTVADNVPKFNIERGCKVDSTASSLDAGLDESIKRCVHDEQQAQDQLQTQWSQFAPSDKAMCTSLTTEGGGVPPSYVELLTCLQGQQLAKKLNKYKYRRCDSPESAPHSSFEDALFESSDVGDVP